MGLVLLGSWLGYARAQSMNARRASLHFMWIFYFRLIPKPSLQDHLCQSLSSLLQVVMSRTLLQTQTGILLRGFQCKLMLLYILIYRVGMTNVLYTLSILQLLALFSPWNHICLHWPNAAYSSGMTTCVLMPHYDGAVNSLLPLSSPDSCLHARHSLMYVCR